MKCLSSEFPNFTQHLPYRCLKEEKELLICQNRSGEVKLLWQVKSRGQV